MSPRLTQSAKAAVELALKGRNVVMPTIVRKSNKPYKWTVGVANLDDVVANVEKKLPARLHYR